MGLAPLDRTAADRHPDRADELLERRRPPGASPAGAPGQQAGHDPLQHDPRRQLVVLGHGDEAEQDVVALGRSGDLVAGEPEQLVEVDERLAR